MLGLVLLKIILKTGVVVAKTSATKKASVLGVIAVAGVEEIQRKKRYENSSNNNNFKNIKNSNYDDDNEFKSDNNNTELL
jgi:hypothetical protein